MIHAFARVAALQSKFPATAGHNETTRSNCSLPNFALLVKYFISASQCVHDILRPFIHSIRKLLALNHMRVTVQKPIVRYFTMEPTKKKKNDFFLFSVISRWPTVGDNTMCRVPFISVSMKLCREWNINIFLSLRDRLAIFNYNKSSYLLYECKYNQHDVRSWGRVLAAFQRFEWIISCVNGGCFMWWRQLTDHRREAGK